MAHLNGHLLWHKYVEPLYQAGNQVLEIGPAGYPTYYEKTLKEKGLRLSYQVLDVRNDFISGAEENPHFILSANELHYPFEDDCFDIVFSDQVLPYVGSFWLWYDELKRITKPGGYIITITAYSYPICPSPLDYWRVHAEGMKELNQQGSLETILCKTESLELAEYGIPQKTGYYFAGASIKDPNGGREVLRANLIKRNWNRIVGNIPKLRALLLNPVQVSFDTITIARVKQSQANP